MRELVEINSGLYDAGMEIAQRRAQTLREIRKLLIADKDREALKLMRKHLNVNEAQTSRADRRYPRSLALVKGK